VNWPVLQRPLATWLKTAGVDVENAQALPRLSRASTTMFVGLKAGKKLSGFGDS
jgi:hypothetical protein